jgi:hypothetical protein
MRSRRDFLTGLGVAAFSPLFPGCGTFSAGESLSDVRIRYEKELFENIVPFWEKYSPDGSPGIFLGVSV